MAVIAHLRPQARHLVRRDISGRHVRRGRKAGRSWSACPAW
jgi:hypothetical protein